MTRKDMAEQNIKQYQAEVRLLQLQSLAQTALTRKEAQRHLAEAALIRATLSY